MLLYKFAIEPIDCTPCTPSVVWKLMLKCALRRSISFTSRLEVIVWMQHEHLEEQLYSWQLTCAEHLYQALKVTKNSHYSTCTSEQWILQPCRATSIPISKALLCIRNQNVSLITPAICAYSHKSSSPHVRACPGVNWNNFSLFNEQWDCDSRSCFNHRWLRTTCTKREAGVKPSLDFNANQPKQAPCTSLFCTALHVPPPAVSPLIPGSVCTTFTFSVMGSSMSITWQEQQESTCSSQHETQKAFAGLPSGWYSVDWILLPCASYSLVMQWLERIIVGRYSVPAIKSPPPTSYICWHLVSRNANEHCNSSMHAKCPGTLFELSCTLLVTKGNDLPCRSRKAHCTPCLPEGTWPCRRAELPALWSPRRWTACKKNATGLHEARIFLCKRQS